MLVCVVAQLKDAPVLIRGTYRDFEVRRSQAVWQPVGDLTREGTQVPLFALSREDAARMIEARAGAPPSPRLVSDIHQAAAGNPLFIDGLVRVLAVEGEFSHASRLYVASFPGSRVMRERLRHGVPLR